MKNICVKILVTIVLTTIILSFTNYCYADVVEFSMPSLQESFGYVNPNGHRGSLVEPYYVPYWNIATLIRNLLILFVILIAIIFTLWKILRNKDSLIKKIVPVILVIVYIVFSGIMIVKAYNTNNVTSDYGIFVYNLKSEIEHQPMKLSNIIKVLNSIKNGGSIIGRKKNHFNKYNYINVDLEIKTTDYNYINTFSPDEALQAIIDEVKSNLDSKKEYYIRIDYMPGTLQKIIVSDERIN